MEFIKKANTRHIFLIFLAIGICVFISVFFNGFVGDDKEQIYNHALVNKFSEIPRVFLYHHEVLEHNGGILGSYYKPLMLLFFYTIRTLFGLNPFFYHAPQVFLGIINALLVFVLFKKFLKQEIAFFCAVIFLIHPINQESMAYVSNIQDILFFLFGISGLLLLTYFDSPKKKLACFLLLLLSLFSKETGILFLLISLTYVFLFKKNVLKIFFLGLTGIIAFYLILRFTSQGTNVFWIEPSPMSQLSTQERLKHIPSLFFYYLKTFLFPIILTFNQQWIIKDVTKGNFLFPLIFSLIFIGTIIFTNTILFIKKSKQFMVLLFFSTWFFIGLLPHLQIVSLDATVADRWFYFSSVGALGILGLFVQFLITRYKNYQNLVLGVTLMLCILLGVRTFARNMDWKDSFTLYGRDTNRAKSALMENNLGDEYFKMGDFENAKLHFNKALSINSELWIAINNLGILEEKKGNYEKALIYYKNALQKNERLPIHENITRTLVLNKKPQEAIRSLRPVLKKYPLSANLWLIQSLALYDLGKLQEALDSAKKSYELLPDPKTYNVVITIENEIQKRKN